MKIRQTFQFWADMEEKTRGRHPTCGPVRCFFPFAWLPLRQVLYLLSLWPRAHQRVSQRGAQEWLVSFVPGSFPLWLPPKGCHQRHRDMRSTAWRGSWGGASRRGPRFSEGSWGSRFHPGFYLVDFLRCVSEKKTKTVADPLSLSVNLLCISSRFPHNSRQRTWERGEGLESGDQIFLHAPVTRRLFSRQNLAL